MTGNLANRLRKIETSKGNANKSPKKVLQILSTDFENAAALETHIKEARKKYGEDALIIVRKIINLDRSTRYRDH